MFYRSNVFLQVFNRLWGVTLDTGASPLTPVDLLVALHLIDSDKCDVKTVIKGIVRKSLLVLWEKKM